MVISLEKIQFVKWVWLKYNYILIKFQIGLEIDLLFKPVSFNAVMLVKSLYDVSFLLWYSNNLQKLGYYYYYYYYLFPFIVQSFCDGFD